MLRKIFGPKRDEITEEWRGLHNVEPRDFCPLPYIIRVINSIRMGLEGHVTRMGESRDLHRILVGESEGKRQLVRSRRRWECNIKMGL
jgi:hypothetical protein